MMPVAGSVESVKPNLVGHESKLLPVAGILVQCEEDELSTIYLRCVVGGST